MFVGFAFWLYHPWFVCTEPNADGEVVVVSATDEAKCVDKTCILPSGTHVMITKESAIYYDDAKFMAVEALERMEKNGTLKPSAIASDDLMVRIRRGAVDSFHTPNDVRAAVRRSSWKPRAVDPDES